MSETDKPRCPKCGHAFHWGKCGRSDGFHPAGCSCVAAEPVVKERKMPILCRKCQIDWDECGCNHTSAPALDARQPMPAKYEPAYWKNMARNIAEAYERDRDEGGLLLERLMRDNAEVEVQRVGLAQQPHVGCYCACEVCSAGTGKHCCLFPCEKRPAPTAEPGDVRRDQKVLVKNKSTEENRKFWSHVEWVAAEVDAGHIVPNFTTNTPGILDALVADLRDHYNTDWDTTVPGKEFDAEIRRIVTKHLDAAYRLAREPKTGDLKAIAKKMGDAGYCNYDACLEYLEEAYRLASEDTEKLQKALQEIENMAHRAWEDKSTIKEIFMMIEMKAKHPIPETLEAIRKGEPTDYPDTSESLDHGE